MEIALFFFWKAFNGGTSSYTINLFHALKEAGANPSIYRVRARGEHFARKFADYEGVEYTNITAEEALKIVKHTPSLMTAPCEKKLVPFDPDIIAKLLKKGMRYVIHDPQEFKVYEELGLTDYGAPFCIRPAMKRLVENAVFIPHPYRRTFGAFKPEHVERKKIAVCVARTTSVKRTNLILDANRLLPKKLKVELRGNENRMYTHHVLAKKYPEYKQGGKGFPMIWGESSRECARAHLAVDFTYFKDDGGGSQYSFMDAWDAGTINVIHKDWLRYNGEMKDGENCIAVGSPEELAAFIKEYAGKSKWTRYDKIIFNGYDALKKHDPKVIGRRYIKELTR